jgi:hypothetical protein
MLRLDIRIVRAHCETLGVGKRLLKLGRELVKAHVRSVAGWLFMILGDSARFQGPGAENLRFNPGT